MDLENDYYEDLGWQSPNYYWQSCVCGHNSGEDCRDHMPFGIGRSRRQVALCSIDGEEVAKGTVRAMENWQFITRIGFEFF
jgi:hypothetical protein